MVEKIKRLINDGEGLTVEFKRCRDELANSVFETISAFSNRYGGYVLLGVEDDGIVSGVNPAAVTNIKKNFVSMLNNPQRFAPTLFIALDAVEVDGKTVLFSFVPPNSQVVMFGGKIFDRAEDGDMDISRNSTMVAHIHQRKAADYSERRIFPYVSDTDFEFERLMPIVRRLAVSNRSNHPWGKMSDEGIVNSAGLYQRDPTTGKSGYNLAAVLLFGREELIKSCTPNYATDAILRKENIDRYDDRLVVAVNLIDAYDQLVEFIMKNSLDRFFLVNNQRVSVISWIARELVSNILAHREYTSAFAAKIVIESDCIVAENWSLPRAPGRIDPNNFSPLSKNPLIANFFVNIGRADRLGSGVRNLYYYTQIYSGKQPELVDGDVFRTIIPTGGLNDKHGLNDNVNDNMNDKLDLDDNLNDKLDLNDNLNDKPDLNDNRESQMVLRYLEGSIEISVAETSKLIGRSHSTARRLLLRMMAEGLVAPTGANRNRKYKRV